MNWLETLSPLELTVLSIVISLIFILTLDNGELNVIGNTLIGIGGLMIIASSQGEFLTGLGAAGRDKKTTDIVK